MRYYRCIQILAAEGLPEAVQIWATMRLIYDHLRGRRGPQCEVKEMNEAIIYANEIIEKNRGVLDAVLQNQARLEQNLQHDIHKEDNVIEHAEYEIHNK